jgi:hypothetical protein
MPKPIIYGAKEKVHPVLPREGYFRNLVTLNHKKYWCVSKTRLGREEARKAVQKDLMQQKEILNRFWEKRLTT